MDPNPLTPSLGGPQAPPSPAAQPPAPSLERMLSAIYHKLNALEARQAQGFEEVSERLDELESAIRDLSPAETSALEDKLDDVQRRVESLSSTLGDVEGTLSGIESTVGNIESTVDGL